MAYTALGLQQAIVSLAKAATPKDGSAPLSPILALGQLAIENQDLLERALVYYRQNKEGARV